MRTSIFERLFGIALGFFVAAMLVTWAVRLIQSILPMLIVIAVGAGVIVAFAWWFRRRRDSW